MRARCGPTDFMRYLRTVLCYTLSHRSGNSSTRLSSWRASASQGQIGKTKIVTEGSLRPGRYSEYIGARQDQRASKILPRRRRRGEALDHVLL
jgi:hypothetical protein